MRPRKRVSVVATTTALFVAALFVAALFVAALFAASVVGGTGAYAARSASGLRVVSISAGGIEVDGLDLDGLDQDGLDQVALNQVIEIRFDARVAPSSLSNGAIAIHALGDDGEPIGDPRPGVLRRKGNVVRFVPTLPTHARDPAGDFFPPGSPRDDAFENGSFRSGTDYRVTVSGGRAKPAVRGAVLGRLRRTTNVDFRTADGTTADPLFLPEEYPGRLLPDELSGSPAPRVRFAVPTSDAASSADGYARFGGAPSTPVDSEVTLFLNGIPLDPASVRADGAVTLTLVERLATGEPPIIVPGDAFLEQDRNRTLLVFRPREALLPQSTYALRIAGDVTDLTGAREVDDHLGRRGVRDIYDGLAAARAAAPGTPPEFLPDPPNELILNWPPSSDAAARGELKRNVLALGDTRPWEADPRVFALFTTRRDLRLSPPTPAAPDARRRRDTLARITRVVTPIGLQGNDGAGNEVVLPFELSQRRGRDAFVELQYGADFDDDGAIDESEFRRATIDSRDVRTSGDTRRTRDRGTRRLFEFASTAGTARSNAITWNSTADLEPTPYLLLQDTYAPDGREIEDPSAPRTTLRVPGRGGVVLRLRSVRVGRRASEWVATAPFELNNNVPPTLALHTVTPGDPTLVLWTPYDDDSEDKNGNGNSIRWISRIATATVSSTWRRSPSCSTTTSSGPMTTSRTCAASTSPGWRRWTGSPARTRQASAIQTRASRASRQTPSRPTGRGPWSARSRGTSPPTASTPTLPSSSAHERSPQSATTTVRGSIDWPRSRSATDGATGVRSTVVGAPGLAPSAARTPRRLSVEGNRRRESCARARGLVQVVGAPGLEPGTKGL